MRVDVFLFQNGYTKSRQYAKTIIKEGRLLVNGRVCEKPSLEVTPDDTITITGENLQYVGRGGLKLETAINTFGITLKDLVCIDIGASTGGFTDCMLQNGACKVYAVDVGHGQLDSKLLSNDKVVNLEGTNIRNVDSSTFEGSLVDFISIDVSFISLKLVLPTVYTLLRSGGSVVALIKPQFEAGKGSLSKGGIVKSEKVRQSVVQDIQSFSIGLGFKVLGVCQSAITGGDGNVEYLIYMSKE